MSNFTRVSINALFAFLLAFTGNLVYGQAGVLNPADPIVVYNPAAPPATPAFGQMAKWVKTNRVGFTTTSFKSYYYKGMVFRLKFPKSYQHGVADGKTYPVWVFFHGVGEKGTIYDNEYQLFHGGQEHMNNVDNGNFDGFLLYPQASASSGFFGTAQYGYVKEIIENYLVPQVKADINRVIIEGLSGGGTSTWQFTGQYPTLVAAAHPISAASLSFRDYSNNLKFTPIWQFQGGLDNNPHPNTTIQIVNHYKNAGADFTYTLYPNVGHGAWPLAWIEKDYYPSLNRAHKANPWPLTGRTEFCPGDPISLVIGVTPGFTGYEWRKDGVVIPGATSNQITATTVGTYDVRIRRGTTWSVFSPIPVVVKLKAPTVPPAITIAAGQSKVIPALDTTTGVTLSVPAGYASYVWQKEGSTTTLGTSNTFRATTPGDYKVKVTEQYGCSSDFSAPFKVIDANGPNKPEPAANLVATSLSKTSIKLDWTDNASATYNETGYEIYEGLQANGPYTLKAVTAQNAATYTVTNLNSNIKYYYVLRAINGTGASAKSNEASATTDKDSQAPTAPGNLNVTGVSKNYVALKWDASTDDVGVTKYEIYVNGALNYTTTATAFTVTNLQYKQNYIFKIVAKDFAGNASQPSNQVAAQTVMKGLDYKHYTFSGTWNAFPNLNALTPVTTGTHTNVTLSGRTRDDGFAFLWEGYIRIPVTGTYYLRTNSDDGSNLWLGALNGNGSPYNFATAPTVNNDGLHGGQDRTSAALNLTAGIYPIAIAFYEQGGGEAITVSWQTPQTGGGFTPIPDSAFNETAVGAAIPATPSAVAATTLSYKSIRVNWADNSNNETGFEVFRSLGVIDGWSIVGTTAANATSFTDTSLNAGTRYYYKVRAVGLYGESPFAKGTQPVDYRYYEIDNMSVVPNFDALTPVKTGKQNDFSLGVQNRGDNFALRLASYITVPVTGTYTFYTSSDDGSKLWIGSTLAQDLIVNNDGLHGTQEASGTKTLSAGRLYPIYVGFFEAGGGEVLEVRYSGPGVAKQIIPSSVLGDPSVNALTSGAPSAPAAPTALLATGISRSSIGMTWTDNANNETGYEVYRAAVTPTTFTLVATTAPDANSYTDTALNGNTIYHYRVRAKGEIGFSAYSNTDTALTANSKPVIAKLPVSQYTRFDQQLQLNLSATDADGETLTFSFVNLPAFGTFVPGANGAGVLTFAPNASSQGTYNNILAIVSDPSGGKDTSAFSLVVNDNYRPVINPVSNITVSEKQVSNFALVSVDQNGTGTPTWTFTGLPAFVQTSFAGDSAKLTLAPGYTDNGTYTVVAKVDDGNFGVDSTTFTITVVDVNPNKTVNVNLTSGTYVQAAPWNNTSKTPAVGDNFPALKDVTGAATAIGISFPTAWTGINNQGGNTGNNSGAYPDNVIRSSIYTSVVSTIRIYGLEIGTKYNFKFLGSRAAPAAGIGVVAQYTIAGQSVTLDAANNVANTVSINGVDPQADGSVILTVQKAAGSSFAYLNGMTIEAVFGNGTAPAAPRGITAALNGNKVKLDWTDAAFNETSYEVARATELAGPYTTIATGAANLVTYTDSTILGNHSYYYAVRALNATGASAYSDTVKVVTPNVAPVISGVANVTMKTGQTFDLNVTGADGPDETVTLSVTGLPAFATFTNNGNGTGLIRIIPGTTKGKFDNIVVTATDNSNLSSSKTFSITVTDASLTTAYINFNQTNPVAAPWNNFNAVPNAGVTLSNVLDEAGAATGINVTLVDKWTAQNTLGVVTGNNSGIYPDDVMRTFYYENSATAKTVRLSGLSTGKKYNLVFFASRAAGPNSLTTRYTVGAQSVDLDANNNSTNTVKLSGLEPSASGEILITMVRTGASQAAYIGAMEIQSYVSDGSLLAPAGLKAAGISKDKINIKWTSTDATVTGYEVFQSATADGTYTKLADVAAGVTTYTHLFLPSPTLKYYKVRAVKNGVFSPFSNYAGANTVDYVVNLNLNDGTAATGPAQGGNWNNTNALISTGFTLSNMKNDAGQPTGINFTMLRSFSGYNYLGTTTGNNSGVVPDNVSKSFYYVNYADTASFKITGLNLAHVYNFVFFGSRVNPSVGVVAAYKIGNEVVTLNAANNTANTVQINNIKPDANGEVSIVMYATIQGGFGYLNALTVHGMPGVADDPAIANTVYAQRPAVVEAVNMNDVRTLTDGTAEVLANNPNAVLRDIVSKFEASSFPNPFLDDVTLKVGLKQPVSKMVVAVSDVNGKFIFKKEYSNIPAGFWQQRLGMNGQSFNRGLYFLQVIIPGEKVETIKLIKR